MSLPTCPSCGQSVLEDNAVDCPFCGAAMDGTRGAKNTPRPKVGPVVNRPGARKIPEKPPTPAETSGPVSNSEPPKPPVRPVSGPRGGKPIVDEDDPFGVGMAAAVSQAIPASLKPEKGRLHKVVCPMCEHVGFVPKSAVGKSVKCANEKCMVPIFTAIDPNEQASDRKPTRMSDTAEAARNAAEAAKPAKRNPLVIYGVVGGILLLLTIIVLPLLTKPPELPDNKAIVFDSSKFGPTDEEIDAEKKKAAGKQKALADASNPHVEATAHVRRMISMARQPTLRDKAWGRRLTGDLYLRLEDATLASQEFNQLLSVERTRSYYRIDPQLTRHWRAIAAGDSTTAKKSLADSLADLPTLPKSGRVGIDAALGLSAALVNDGKIAEAAKLIAARQLDTTIADNRDAIASTAWLFASFRCRDASLPAPTVQDAMSWVNPLHTAVAIDLAVHDRWEASVTWSKTASEPRAVTDALVAVLEIATLKKASAEVIALLETASGNDVVSSIRVKAAVAVATKDATRLDACLAAFTQLAPPSPVTIPAATQLVQDDVPDRSSFLYQAVAVAEVVRAAVATGRNETAATAMNRLLSELAAVAPSTASIRVPVNQIENNETVFRKQLAMELRVSDETQFGSMFRNYRRHLEQFAKAAEDRRLLGVLLLSRIVRAGGTAVIQQTIGTSTEFKQDLFLDELTGFLAVAARQTGQQFPEVFGPDASLRRGRALFGNAALVVPIAAVTDISWANRDQNPAASLKAIESGTGTDLPGLRLAMVCELVESVSGTTKDPATVLTAISQLQNGVWREESYIIAGRVFADRKIDKKAEIWMAGVKLPAMEQISLLYGISLGILERPVPALTSSSADGKEAEKPATGG